MQDTFFAYENFEQALSRGGEYVTQVREVSMYPMLRYRRDPVLIQPVRQELKRYDVAVYNRGDGYVVHRILEVRPHSYVFRGDNCIGSEIVGKDLVLGIVTGFWRVPSKGGTGRFVSVENRWYRLYSRIWVALNPVNVKFIGFVHRCCGLPGRFLKRIRSGRA